MNVTPKATPSSAAPAAAASIPSAKPGAAPIPDGPLSPNELLEARKELAAFPSLSTMRATFHTKLVRRGVDAQAAPEAGEPFLRVKYDAPVGKLVAYVTKDPGDGKQHPAIVWITGGDNNTIGNVWTAMPRENDQSAAAFRKAGLVMMFPSQRGGNDNPGRREGFLGEVDDVIAARAHVASLSYVDPQRIYLGGHSSGGTLALLVAESTPLFRAVFSFGPAGNVANYGGDLVYCDVNDTAEIVARSPFAWLKDIRSPTFVFEGVDGNVDDLRVMRQINENPRVTFYEVEGANHFDVLAPINEMIARKLVADTSPHPNITFTPNEIRRAFGEAR